MTSLKSGLKKIAIRAANIFSRIVGKGVFGSVIIFLSRAGQVDLLTLAYRKMGIANFENSAVSGEGFAMAYIKNRMRKETPVLFDIGANKGNYSAELSRTFPHARIFAFEPSKQAYERATKNLLGSNVQVCNIGFGADETGGTLYTYSDELDSEHGSVFKDVFTNIHHAKNVVEVEFLCTTIDIFCAKHGISFIDFLKIDTEGNELAILRGAPSMLAAHAIPFIQFEFNEMNVVSRVFLRDFYEILPGYEFYRLAEKRLIPLQAYSTSNEIFRFQNILAIDKNSV